MPKKIKSKGHVLKARKKQLYKLIVARSDIAAAMNACKLFLEKVKPRNNSEEEQIKALGNKHYYPLLNAIVVCYGRPFSDNKPLGPLPKKWYKFSAPIFQQAHKALLELRDKMIAHSDLEMRKVSIAPHGTPRPPAIGGFSEGVSVSISSEYWRINRFPIIWETCRDLGIRLNAEIDKESEELYGSSDMPPVEFDLWDDIKKTR